MAYFTTARSDLTGIGAMEAPSGPSSGYAFSFIQKQIDQISNSAKPGKTASGKKPPQPF